MLLIKKSLDNIDQWIFDIKDNLNAPIIIIFQNKSDIDKSRWVFTK